jgi:hypothetical protein
MYTSPEKVEAVITLLVEGCSIRSIQRITWLAQSEALHFDAAQTRASILKREESLR